VKSPKVIADVQPSQLKILIQKLAGLHADDESAWKPIIGFFLEEPAKYHHTMSKGVSERWRCPEDDLDNPVLSMVRHGRLAYHTQDGYMVPHWQPLSLFVIFKNGKRLRFWSKAGAHEKFGNPASPCFMADNEYRVEAVIRNYNFPALLSLILE